MTTSSFAQFPSPDGRGSSSTGPSRGADTPRTGEPAPRRAAAPVPPAQAGHAMPQADGVP